MKSHGLVWMGSRARAWRVGDRVFLWTVERPLLPPAGFDAVEVRLEDVHPLAVQRSLRFSTRWKAKDRAWRWYCRAAGRPFASLHKAPVLAPHDAARRRAQVLLYRKAVTRGGD